MQMPSNHMFLDVSLEGHDNKGYNDWRKFHFGYQVPGFLPGADQPGWDSRLLLEYWIKLLLLPWQWHQGQLDLSGGNQEEAQPLCHEEELEEKRRLSEEEIKSCTKKCHTFGSRNMQPNENFLVWPKLTIFYEWFFLKFHLLKTHKEKIPQTQTFRQSRPC